ncbi:MAG: CRISPR-associated endonuclease Cas3'' [Notoacmeibacter sp.]|nr:CRISPR-associated endonuclease Cas3'' [Notoacmeibacter sp.]
MFYAHSAERLPQGEWQPLREHLVGVGSLAELFGNTFGVGKAARLAGLLHDVGKYTVPFQARLQGGEPVDHSTAGALIIRELASDPRDRIAAELIAYAIAGHHAGMPDRIGASGSLAERLKKTLDPLAPRWRDEIAPDTRGIMPEFRLLEEKAAFQLSFLGRMIFSCLVDADFRDTEAYYDRIEGRQREREWRALGSIVCEIAARFDAYMAKKQAGCAQNMVNALRSDVLAYIRAKAGEPTGLFTLTVPTGGGKTLASLGFALDHARRHSLERIIYAIPFTSIIDQTAAIFRDVLGDDIVLEHHSAIDEDSFGRREGADKLKLAMEDWAAPIIVTTNVQLFESLFSNRPSRCRKLHNIARSVIVLDEAQTIPLPVLRPCVAALDELARNYGTSIVLCTATQPALAAPKFDGGLALAGRELAPDPAQLARKLGRVTIRREGPIDDEGLVEALSRVRQGLVIINSRAHALSLYRRAKEAGLEGAVHLTTRQYAAHRRKILAGVRAALTGGRPCRLIATSLVEAGVDLDFPRVWRAEAGLDQIAQAAGRCNREGKRSIKESIVTVFETPDNPPPPEIRQLAGDFARMEGKHDDLLSPAAIQAYFDEVYWRKGERLDAKKVLDKFRLNGAETDFAYRTVAEEFRLIESGMAPVIVPGDKRARAAVQKLGLENIPSGAIARTLQPYTVQVPPKARMRLVANGHVAFAEEKLRADQFAVLRTESLYKPETGLIWEDAEYLGLEQWMI